MTFFGAIEINPPSKRTGLLVALRGIAIMPFDKETERRLLDYYPTLTFLDLRPSAIVTEITPQTLTRLATALNISTHIESLGLSFHLFDDICSQYLNYFTMNPQVTIVYYKCIMCLGITW
jgi:hypothetical protein